MSKKIEGHPFLNMNVTSSSHLDELTRSVSNAVVEEGNERERKSFKEKKSVFQRLKKKMSPKKSLVIVGKSDLLEVERSDSFSLECGPLQEGESLDDRPPFLHQSINAK
eukprot:m.14751 g.14751  ORF g.14751 m.14751 type:complete len:109 (-) comp7758_c0_seq1:348-674(-)